MFLVLLVLSISTPTFLAQQVEVVFAKTVQTPNAQLLLQQGIKLYEAQQFSEAIAVWQQVVSTFAQQGDSLTEALVLSNLSSAYQELGQWSAAEDAIAKSLNLLHNLKDLTPSQTYWEIQAKALNTQGSLEWAKGNLEEALATWKQTTATYAKAGNHIGVIGSSLNQAKALQALGLSHQAEKTLAQINEILNFESDPALKATGLLHFGNALRRVGKLAQSRQVLAQSVEIAIGSSAKASALLELGNTELALSHRAIAIGKNQEGIEHAQYALKFYQQASELGRQIQPQLNQLSLLVETGQKSQANKLWPQIQQSIANLPPSRTAIYAQLNLARSLTCLKLDIDTKAISCINDEQRERLLAQTPAQPSPSWPEIAKILATSVQQAQRLQDLRAESYALGQMGELYELTKQWSDAQNLTQKALFIAQEILAPEIRYRWEWQLGRLLEKQKDTKGAIASYTTAVETLKSVRSDLFTINPDVQFSFRDQAEPLYRELVDLLLSNQGNVQPSQENLKRAIANIDSLQLAELENFLGCNLTQTVSLNQNLEQVSRQAAFIYPIILKDRLEVIFKLPGQPIGHYGHLVQQAVVEKTLEELRTALLGRNAGKVRKISQQVYEWLLEPLESHLQKSNEIETLVFVLDGNLRNIPMSILYDSKTNKYLIEKKYTLALLPNAQLFDIRTKPKQLKILGAGISTALEVENRRFDPINTTAELQQIKQVASSKILINSEFTRATLQQNLKSGGFSVVHLATHGNFSSDPEQTFILAYGELLKSNDLNNLLVSGKQGASGAIELLVLSACETAEGDSRATLGLAGLAVKSGARSTLATLWQVSDESTVKLMGQFYKQLNQPGMSKAQALHRAQQALLQEPKYQNPYYWAPYVLVGNWF
ncbi:CHAT domain-containing protein [Nostoc sp. CENA67]|uniref:CHAT domain-containing protein n=1 Tax=Amazonocrinis nigriterrae CENA67 TaxID=2794033 RepID=A0A8J7HSK8_9NOST|nr:CHAT domain-containing protein [Amazonocrinis nigriterrae]MBH8561614.1 CHAT domain-containing protein [Amazonocrinis nigriterrae CENA67]